MIDYSSDYFYNIIIKHQSVIQQLLRGGAGVLLMLVLLRESTGVLPAAADEAISTAACH
jgi:hypothetical protein